MKTGDLIEILSEYGDIPIVINGPGKKKLVVNKIESKKTKANLPDNLHISLCFDVPADPTAWSHDATGV